MQNPDDRKKSDPVLYEGRPVDELFDGHLEKPLRSMSPREKIYYLWLQMQFRWQIRNREIVESPVTTENSGDHF